MPEHWTSRGWLAWLLWPVSLLFRVIVSIRALAYRYGLQRVVTSSVPVIVVGNISVGGTGKTPLVIALSQRLQAAGFSPGIVSRGYGGKAQSAPLLLDATTTASIAGDEPVLLMNETGVPVCVCTKRVAAVGLLADTGDIDIIISDDGLQHYAMDRTLEIAVLDARRGVGNGWLLPAGCLREPVSRLRGVDLIAIQSTPQQTGQVALRTVPGLNSAPIAQFPTHGHFYLSIEKLVCIGTSEETTISIMHGKPVHAVAGLGDPARFFTALSAQSLDVCEHPMPDHHAYVESDISFDDDLPVLVTSKDAVKIRALQCNLDNVFEVCVKPELSTSLDALLDRLIRRLKPTL